MPGFVASRPIAAHRIVTPGIVAPGTAARRTILRGIRARTCGALRVPVAQLLAETLALIGIHLPVGQRRRRRRDPRARREREGGQCRAAGR